MTFTPAQLDRLIAMRPADRALTIEIMAQSGRVRTARKVWRCVNAHARTIGNPAAAMCRVTIHPGEQYVEGDVDPYLAGGFGHDKICTACAKAGAA